MTDFETDDSHGEEGRRKLRPALMIALAAVLALVCCGGGWCRSSSTRRTRPSRTTPAAGTANWSTCRRKCRTTADSAPSRCATRRSSCGSGRI